MTQMNYEKAGVSIRTGDAIVDAIKSCVNETHQPGVLSSLGGFAGLFDIKQLCDGYDEPILVQSIDGVGTKSLVASFAKQYQYIGHDLVAATVNDILVCGATPKTMLDYVASSKLSVDETSAIIQSIASACGEAKIALMGGETAEMPDTYSDDAYDIVGIVTGVVDKSRVIDGTQISRGDVVLGLPSTGLHTNGYSLARRVLFDIAKLNVDSYMDSLNMTIGEALLAAHKNYQFAVLPLLEKQLAITGMAHITGGGIKGNFSRILPKHLNAKLSLEVVTIPPIFKLIQDMGHVADDDMYQAFNMGVGYMIVCRQEAYDDVTNALQDRNEPFVKLGEIIDGHGEVVFV